MNSNKQSPRRTNRRVLLQQGLACTLLPSAAGLLGAEAAGRADDRTLVLVHLSGGNDGLNAVIPYADPLYHQLRPHLGVVSRQAIRINEQVGFHSALAPLARLFDQGRLAVVQGVGHAQPDYSHVGSCRLCAGLGCDRQGLLDQALTAQPRPELALAVGGSPLVSMLSPNLVRVVEPAANLAENPLGYTPGATLRTLAAAAHMAARSHPPRVILATIGGFDTHSNQLAQHEQVLGEFAKGLAHFHDQLARRGRAEHVLLIAWSEFGRRPAENATGGTDHGWAGPAFLLGQTVKGGLYGQNPSLEHTAFGNLIPSVELRAVYQLGAQWLGCENSANVPAFGQAELI